MPKSMVLLFLSLIGVVLGLSPTAIHSHEQSTRQMIEYYRGNFDDATLDRLSSVISQYAHQYEIESSLVVAIMWHESQLQNRQSYLCQNHADRNCENRSNREKSCGFGQMQPETFELTMGYPPMGETRLEQCRSLILDWPTAVHAVVKHLRQLRDRYGYLEGIGGYNCSRCRHENKWYVRKILNFMHPLSGFH